MPGSMLIGCVWQEKFRGNRPPREVEPRVSGWEGGRAPQQPDFAVWLQERHRAKPNGSERGRGRSFRARFVVLTTILQSRITHRATATADARLARNGVSVWCGQVGTDYGLSRRTTTLVSLARHAHLCRLNFAAQTALICCFSQVGPSDQNELLLLLLPGDS